MSLITLSQITKSYFLEGGKEIPVLKGIDIDIQAGEFVALMGPSGSGKSTLLNIIGFLHPSSSGQYMREGEDIAEYKEDEMLSYIRNQKCGFIFQQYFLIPRLTAVENVMLPALYAGISRSEARKKALKLLDEVGLSDVALQNPSQLSGGQQQRVAVARALVNDPMLILADEPTGALDSKTGKEVMDLLGTLQEKGVTIVMVTHDPGLAQLADRIISLKDGVVESG